MSHGNDCEQEGDFVTVPKTDLIKILRRLEALEESIRRGEPPPVAEKRFQ